MNPQERAAWKDRIREHFAARKQEIRGELVSLTTELVAQKTVNAGRSRLGEFPYLEVPGQEQLAVDVVQRYLDAAGLPSEVHTPSPLRSNILARFGGSGPTLMVGCHLDIVPPDGKWTQADPFVVEERDGYLFGRGVLDNKGPTACCLVALKAMKELAVPLAGTFLLAGIASEEFREPGEPDPGIEYLFKNKLIAPDFAIIPDIGEDMKKIDVAEKGRLGVRVTAQGKAAHGSTPERGVNATYMMARLLTCIEEELHLRHEVHPVLGTPSQNPGILRGGTAANIVPATCTLEIDVRYVPGMTAQGIAAEVKALADKVGQLYRDRLGPDTEPFLVQIDESVSLPHAIDPRHALVRSIQENTKTLLGFTPEPIGIGGGTFCKAFNLAGVPAVGFGPGSDEDFHVADEKISVEQLQQFAELLAVLAVDLVG